MNTKLRKIISMMAMICLLMTSFATAFAEETTETETVSLVEKYTEEVGNKTVVAPYGAANRGDWMAWYLTPSEVGTQKNNTQSTKLSTGYIMVYKFPMPKPAYGQKIGKYILQLSVSHANVQAVDVLKLPGENFNFSTINSNDSLVYDVWKNYAENSALEKNADSTYVDVPYEETSLGSTVKRYFLDVTSYVNELYNAGQRDHFYVIGGIKDTQVNMVGNVTWTGYPEADVNQAVYYSFTDADPLAMTKSFPEAGASITSGAKELSATFNNGIETASVKLNGEALASTVSGATVIVNATLAQYQDYVLEITATDIYGTTESVTINFSAKSATQSDELRDGNAYWITADADPAEVSSKKNIDGRSEHMMVFRMPVPQIAEGQVLDKFTFYITAFSQAGNALIKLPGDDWELTTDTNKDGQMMRYTDENVQPLLDINTNTPCPNTERTSVCLNPEAGKNYLYAQSYDITGYVMECIDKGESYVDLATYAPGSTMDMYGFVAENWNSDYRAKYTYSTIIPEFKALNVEKTIGITSVDALSFNLLTDIDAVADKVVIRDVKTKTPVDAKFSYDSAKRKIVLSNALSLAEKTDYEVVLTACTDIYGNTLSEDMVIATFATSTKYVAGKAKIVAADSTANYDDAVHLGALDKAASYKAIAKVSNNTSADVDVVVAVAEYVDYTVMSVAFTTITVPANTQDCDVVSEAITLSGKSGDAKAFVWTAQANTPLVISSLAAIN